MNEDRIYRALARRLESLSGVVPSKQISWPSLPFTPPSDGTPYYRFFLLPAAPGFDSIASNGVLDRGVAQISVFHPENQGLRPALVLARAVAQHFAKGTRLDAEGIRVKVRTHPVIAPSLEEPGWVQIPVTVPYQSAA